MLFFFFTCVWNHLKPKRNPVGHGSEHRQQEKVQTQRQRDGSGEDTVRQEGRLAGPRLDRVRTMKEQGHDPGKEKTR